MFSPQIRLNIQKVLIIGLAWLLIGIFITLYNSALLQSPFYSLGLSPQYEFGTSLLVNCIISLAGAGIVGTALVIINDRLFRKKSFRYAIISTAIWYTLFYFLLFLVFLIIRISVRYEGQASFDEMLSIGVKMSKNLTVISNYALWGVVSMLTLFVLQINDRFGPGRLRKFLAGKYFQPEHEQRVFMFLDMASSTTIAEEIGNEKYFLLLRNIFSHITNDILDHEGEIYQYVGDEIVISWPLKKAIKKANTIHCFLAIRETLNELENYYRERFGAIPKFKAGVHHGTVMAGEIGVVKKEIIYSGDVLNTAARIQSKCKEFKSDLLISENTLSCFDRQELDSLGFDKIGSIPLRGKSDEVTIMSLAE